MNNYFRSDGWVKTTLGPAIPGAQVFVCTQPANTNSAPPSPLANIYADNAGLVPIAQPMLTDGFGHYDFYAEAGVYTLVIAYAGTIQEVYPDQSVGAVGSGGGGALTLEANGEALPNQVLLNFYSSDATVTFTADEDGDGGLNLQAKGGGQFSTTGQVGFWGPGIISALGTSSSGGSVSTTANQITVFQFVLESTWTLSSASVYVENAVSGQTMNFGFYTLAGDLLLDTGPISIAATGLVKATFTPVKLPAGVYYFAQSATNSASIRIFAFPSASEQETIMNQAGNYLAVAQAANPTVAGVMPATLGTLTADAGDFGAAFVYWGP